MPLQPRVCSGGSLGPGHSGTRTAAGRPASTCIISIRSACEHDMLIKVVTEARTAAGRLVLTCIVSILPACVQVVLVIIGTAPGCRVKVCPVSLPSACSRY